MPTPQECICTFGMHPVARTLSIPVLGTAGILLLAKQKGIISSISAPIQALQDAGLWLADDLVNFLKQQAGELPE